MSRNGGDSAIPRITDIQRDRFDVYLQEPNVLDGWHTTETFSFLVMEKGVWELPDGTIIEVGTVTTNATTREHWQNITFSHDFTSAPIVLTQVQTDNDSDFVRTRHDNITLDGFQVALEEEEADQYSGHGAETIAWLAISPGQGNWDGNTFLAGNTGDQVTHDWHTMDFGNAFNNTPKLLANIATYDGPDSAGLRSQDSGNGGLQIMIEEDTSNDDETWHTTEDVHFLAISATGTLTGSVVESANVDPLTGLDEQQAGRVNDDTFVVGNAQGQLYDSYREQDYLEIEGFDSSNDVIQLYGITDNDTRSAFPSGSSEQGSFLTVAGIEDQLGSIVYS